LLVLLIIFISSSLVSKENVLTPYLKYASLILSLLLTVCIKEHFVDWLNFLTAFISSIDATSNWSIPLFINVLITVGCGFVLTAYNILPGNFFWKNFETERNRILSDTINWLIWFQLTY